MTDPNDPTGNEQALFKSASGPTGDCPRPELLASAAGNPDVQRHLENCGRCRTELAMLLEFEKAEPRPDEPRQREVDPERAAPAFTRTHRCRAHCISATCIDLGAASRIGRVPLVASGSWECSWWRLLCWSWLRQACISGRAATCRVLPHRPAERMCGDRASLLWSLQSAMSHKVLPNSAGRPYRARPHTRSG